MLILASTSDKILVSSLVFTGGTGTVHVHASYVDYASGVVTPVQTTTNTIVTNTNNVTVVPSPPAGTQRDVKSISIYNPQAATPSINSTGNQLTVTHTDGVTPIALINGMALQGGYTLEWRDDDGWQLLNELGIPVSGTSAGDGINAQGIFGDGSDGAGTFDGTSVPAGVTTTGSAPNLTYFLSRDVYYQTVQVNAGIIVYMMTNTGTSNACLAYRMFCAGPCQNNGTISLTPAQPAAGGGQGFGAGVGWQKGNGGTVGGGSSGGLGTSSTGPGGGAVIVSQGFGGAGGAGGAGGSAAGGAGGTVTAPVTGTIPRSTPHASIGAIAYQSPQTSSMAFLPYQGGAGGGGGGGGGSGVEFSGGGGGGGGVMICVLYNLYGTGTFTAAGGQGANAQAGSNGGGGGGGGGGVLLLITAISTGFTGTLTAAGGAGGAGNGTGSVGVAGSAGQVIQLAEAA
jgi:hypothetical protein